MNREVVVRTAVGLAAWLRKRAPRPSVVIGFDARHQSAAFAQDAAEVLAAAGLRVWLLPEPLPTPVLAFAIGHFDANSGVMVTASHNPAGDNGLKVYLADTTQIAAPADAEIAAEIARARAGDAVRRSSAYESVGDDVVTAYLAAATPRRHPGGATLKVAYTPLHGVGGATFLAAAARAGFTDIHVVANQAEPDPNFPTTEYPNPEEPGTLDGVLALGREIAADIVIAHDPDADRCAVAVRSDTGLTVLSGDEIGAVLADQLMRSGRRGTYASSIVSSDLLGALAAASGRPWVQTLTGFKWLGKVPDLAFAYEEALGYCVSPEISRDKDGITAALAVLELAADLKEAGQTLLDRRNELFAVHGVHLTEQVSVRYASIEQAKSFMERLRAQPPASFDSTPVTSVDDLLDGYRGLPATDALRFGVDGGRVIVRPSGTEAKIKAYIEMVHAEASVAQARLDNVASALRAQLGASVKTPRR